MAKNLLTIDLSKQAIDLAPINLATIDLAGVEVIGGPDFNEDFNEDFLIETS